MRRVAIRSPTFHLGSTSCASGRNTGWTTSRPSTCPLPRTLPSTYRLAIESLMTIAERRRRPRSIKTRTTVLFVAYLFALCAVYAGFSVALLRREAASANEQLVQTARMLAAEIDTHVAAGRDRLATVAALPGLVHGMGSM